MGTVSYDDFTVNQLLTAAFMNGFKAAFTNQLNGNIDADNLKDLAVTAGKLAASAVITSKINNSAVTTEKIADDAVSGEKIELDGEQAGDIMYCDGTDWVRIAKGLAYQTLAMNSGATAPAWASLVKNVYDSGMFAISKSTDYAKTHNLGTTKVIPILFCSVTSDGSGDPGLFIPTHHVENGVSHHPAVHAITTTTCIVRCSDNECFTYLNSSQAPVNASSGYARLILIGLV